MSLNIDEKEVRGKSVIEVGSLNINGSARPIVEAFGPGCYVGVDIQMGPGVDEICDANHLVERFGPDRFELLMSTELLEHTRDWRTVISNFKNVIKPNGVMLITTRSRGFVYHGYPFDYWRFEKSDMEEIFADFIIEVIEEDNMLPGIFLKARKPQLFLENDNKNLHIHSIITGDRIPNISIVDICWFKVCYTIGPVLASVVPRTLKSYGRRLFSRQ